MNENDPEARINKYIAENGWSFNITSGQGGKYAVGSAYGVQAYPTNYLVGPDGKILWRGLGFNEADLKAAIKKAVAP